MLAQSILRAAAEVWQPFVLVVGLLAIGAIAAADGLFEAVAARLAQAPLGPNGLLLALLALVAAVTAVLNLDTSVVFLTPVLVHTARRRGVDERPFLYGSVFMANAASTLLPGSNLTNLLVLRHSASSGVAFAVAMLPAWVAACAITAAFVLIAFRPRIGVVGTSTVPELRLGISAIALTATAVLVVALRSPALPVLAVALAAAAARRPAPRVAVRAPALLFVLTTALAALAASWNGPALLLASSGSAATAAIGAAASVLVNNLPASVLFSAHASHHTTALLLGLDIGPNLAVTGSLSAVLWIQAARTAGARPSAVTYSLLGVLLAPLTIATALAVGSLG